MGMVSILASLEAVLSPKFEDLFPFKGYFFKMFL